MASINDNLFTTLIRNAVPNELGCHILTRWGPVTAHFSEQGLQKLYFDDSLQLEKRGNSVFRKAFLKWLDHYQSLTPAARWKYLDLEGTPFQKSVWNELIQIPFGKTTNYQSIAKSIGNLNANRAVGTAVGANPISILIPCHRVIQSNGAIGNYRWGADRKLALLDAEKEAGSDLLKLFK